MGDVMALTNKNDGFLNNSSGFIILILFLLMMNGSWGNFGGNYFNNRDVVSRADLSDGLNTQDIKNLLGNLNSTVNCGFDNVILNQSNGFNGIQYAIADTNYRMQDCCCSIKNMIAEDGAKTRGLIQQNEIQKLRDELQDVKNEQLATGLTTAQIIQTNNLENFIRQIVTPATAPTA